MEEGAELHFLTRMWGQTSDLMANGFKVHECHIPFSHVYPIEGFENIDYQSLVSFAAIVVPAGQAADCPRFTEDINKMPPASELNVEPASLIVLNIPLLFSFPG